MVGSRTRQPLFLCLVGILEKHFMSASTTPTKAVDYFAVFGLPRKLWIEMSALEQKFLQMSWKLHPDNFVNAPEQERELSLKRSSELNDAYRTLRDPVVRVEYLLGIEGARKEGEHKQQAPPELLEEVFELNESLDELDAALQGEAATRKQVMAKLNDLLNRRSYIRNLVVNVQKELL